MADTISVVIPTLNESTLARTIEAVLGQTRPAEEILVVGLDERGVARRYPGVRFIDTGRPVCAAAARNLGIRSSGGAIIAFTDSDCIPAADWLETHARAQAAGAGVAGGGVVGGGVALAGANYWAQADNVSMFHEYVAEHPAGERALLPTLNLSVRREVIEAVGYLEESFPGAAAEDSDWTTRMRLAGYRLRFEPAAVVHHAPLRTRWRDVARHWRNAGYSGIRVRHRYAAEFATPAVTRSAFLLRLLSPLIAARVTAGIYSKPVFRRHLHYLPVVYVTKIIYCFGAAAAIDSGFAFGLDGLPPP